MLREKSRLPITLDMDLLTFSISLNNYSILDFIKDTVDCNAHVVSYVDMTWSSYVRSQENLQAEVCRGPMTRKFTGLLYTPTSIVLQTACFRLLLSVRHILLCVHETIFFCAVNSVADPFKLDHSVDITTLQ
jgi:hypothetical protein